LFQILTKDTIEGELRGFVRQHFETTIPKNNPERLLNAWNELVAEGNQDVIGILKVLDIPQERQKEFISDLNKKYGQAFIEEPEFLKMINDNFKLLKPENDCHVVYFANRVALQDLLETAAREQLGSVTVTMHGLFQTHNVQPSNEVFEEKCERSRPI